MANGEAVKFIAVVLPVGHVVIHDVSETFVVCGFQNVNHFMDHDILKAHGRLFSQFKVEPDAGSPGIAGSPFGFHLSNAKLADGNPNLRFPFFNQLWNPLF